MQSDIIIIGAGAAGLMAARELSAKGKNVLVLEARDRIGGRIHTFQDAVFVQPVEAGAEFVHGNLDLTLGLLKEAQLKTDIAKGEVWRSTNNRLFKQEDFIEDADVLMQALQKQQTEISVGAFLNTHFNDKRHADLKKSVQDYIEGYYAGDLDKASVLALKEEWQREEEPQYRIQGGYTAMMQTIYEQSLKHGCIFQFSSTVKQVTWAFEKVEVITRDGTIHTAKKLLVAVPLPVLQSSGLEASLVFQPQLTNLMPAFNNLGSGCVIKVLIQFKTPFWNDALHLKNLHFLFSDEAVPTWWTQHPRHATLLTGWCAGPHADALKSKSDDQIFQKSIQSLARIFNQPVTEIEKEITAWKICNWAADPYALGGYSYITTTTKKAIPVTSQPVEQTLFFAGEALHDGIDVGTVEAALRSGKQTAHRMIASF